MKSKATLTPTPHQVLGPFFLPMAPLKRELMPSGAKGQRLDITAKVRSVDGRNLAGAIVHVWLADPDGRYDNQDKRGNVISVPASKLMYRARLVTSRRGSVSFTCLRPGNYPLENEPVDIRPAHIHFVVEAPGHKTLITQLYFADDPYNTNDIPREGFFKPELIVPLKPSKPGNAVQRGRFTFVLEPLS